MPGNLVLFAAAGPRLWMSHCSFIPSTRREVAPHGLKWRCGAGGACAIHQQIEDLVPWSWSRVWSGHVDWALNGWGRRDIPVADRARISAGACGSLCGSEASPLGFASLQAQTATHWCPRFSHCWRSHLVFAGLGE